MVLHRLLLPAQLFPECKYKLTEVEFSVGSERFQWSGTTPTSPGYTAVYTWHEVRGLEAPVEFKKGQIWEVVQVRRFYSLFLHLSTSPSLSLSPDEVIRTPDLSAWLPH